MNLSGQKFRRWTVLEKQPSQHRLSRWLCRCECGTIRVVYGRDLRNGSSKSCGCLHKESLSRKNIKHGLSHTSEYQSWYNMIKRCYNTDCAAYPNYGGRGITVCDRWRNEEGMLNFISDMGYKPKKGDTIERIDNEGNYEPSNCIWLSKAKQNRNQRTTKLNMAIAKEIRHLLKQGVPLSKIYPLYEAKPRTIRDVANNKSWVETA